MIFLKLYAIKQEQMLLPVEAILSRETKRRILRNMDVTPGLSRPREVSFLILEKSVRERTVPLFLVCFAERNFVQLSKLDYALVSTRGYSEILHGRVKPVQFYIGT